MHVYLQGCRGSPLSLSERWGRGTGPSAHLSTPVSASLEQSVLKLLCWHGGNHSLWVAARPYLGLSADSPISRKGAYQPGHLHPGGFGNMRSSGFPWEQQPTGSGEEAREGAQRGRRPVGLRACPPGPDVASSSLVGSRHTRTGQASRLSSQTLWHSLAWDLVLSTSAVFGLAPQALALHLAAPQWPQALPHFPRACR